MPTRTTAVGVQSVLKSLVGSKYEPQQDFIMLGIEKRYRYNKHLISIRIFQLYIEIYLKPTR